MNMQEAYRMVLNDLCTRTPLFRGEFDEPNPPDTGMILGIAMVIQAIAQEAFSSDDDLMKEFVYGWIHNVSESMRKIYN